MARLYCYYGFLVLNRPPPNYDGHVPLTVTESIVLGIGEFDPRILPNAPISRPDYIIMPRRLMTGLLHQKTPAIPVRPYDSRANPSHFPSKHTAPQYCKPCRR
ncbi:hypothetical protein K469DRAFT_239351 [Zopfia rhizophila CBS 207.26]|uniref:Uncharacterized protein n=1 Tax=Zopfia rhizophila CBS 207.26 TaxID=1314779 RepID=A0A6A6ERL4_9PEZI|nr:hypothetical protein K469DRAFT_239351 [Zopfia rhizophila CBS 207.26]